MDGTGRGWHTYIKDCPKPAVERYGYLDGLESKDLMILYDELRTQTAVVQRLLASRSDIILDINGDDDDEDDDDDDDVDIGEAVVFVKTFADAQAMIQKALKKDGTAVSPQELQHRTHAFLEQLKKITGSRLEPELGIGVRVMAKWKGGDAFPGQITAMNGDGTYAVQFDDGDYDGHIPESHIMPA